MLSQVASIDVNTHSGIYDVYKPILHMHGTIEER